MEIDILKEPRFPINKENKIIKNSIKKVYTEISNVPSGCPLSHPPCKRISKV